MDRLSSNKLLPCKKNWRRVTAYPAPATTVIFVLHISGAEIYPLQALHIIEKALGKSILFIFFITLDPRVFGRPYKNSQISQVRKMLELVSSFIVVLEKNNKHR
jgi:hypothetical protein